MCAWEFGINYRAGALAENEVAKERECFGVFCLEYDVSQVGVVFDVMHFVFKCTKNNCFFFFEFECIFSVELRRMTLQRPGKSRSKLPLLELLVVSATICFSKYELDVIWLLLPHECILKIINIEQQFLFFKKKERVWTRAFM